MKDQIRFNSVLHGPNRYGFVYLSDTTAQWDICYRTSGLFSHQSFWYETLGDNGTQHTPIRPVTLTKRAKDEESTLAIDWFLSFARYLVENPGDYDYSMDHIFGFHQIGSEDVNSWTG